MKSRAFFKAAMTVVAGGGALLANAETDVASTVEVVDSVEISTDTNVVVETGRTLKFEYVHGENSVTLTKSGAGRLEIATSSHTNLSVNIAEGTFASARPAPIPLTDEFRPTLRIDASRTDTFTLAPSGGTNFISKIVDADGGIERFLTSWGGIYKKPYVADEKLNGLGLIDFGTYYDRDIPYFSGGWGGNLAVNNAGHFTLKEYFYVWKDRDDIFDAPLIDGKEFRGPSILGNDGNYFLRGMGGAGNGFELIADGTHSTYKEGNLVVDSKKVTRVFRPSRGFHLLRNRANETITPARTLTTIGVNSYKMGGFVLAEIVAYSNTLSEANAKRVEAQLQSKWMGMNLNTVTMQNAATLDVAAFKFKIKTLDLAGDAFVAGDTNLCFDALTRSSSNVVVSGVMRIDGLKQSLVPDVKFEGEAKLDVSGTCRIQTISSDVDKMVKYGVGELLLADPEMSDVTVSEGILNISPLYVRSAEYHLDSTRADTIEWTEEDGKKLISKWHDMEDSSRMFKKTGYRKPGYDDSRLVRPPYIKENAVGDKTMVDFGTFANYNYPDGWGGCLDAEPSIGAGNGAHDFFAVWMDRPEVKNYAFGGDGKPFIGPCIFGMQYHWSRGLGGNGQGFPIHNSNCPINMWSPPESGLVCVDNVIVNGAKDPIDDGVHILSQRTTHNDGKPGAPLEQLGGSYQAQSCNSEGVRTNGTYGGLLIGEVLVFKNTLPDRFRMRISGALCSKWRGDLNEWEYDSLKVESGATLKHPYADLVPETMDLAGKISAVSVRPKSLKIVGNEAEIDGMLKLADGGSINIAGDPENGFESLKATSVHASGKGGITMTMANPSAYVGEEYKIIDSANVVAEPDFQWRAAALHGTGTRVSLKAKSDGVYLSFDGCGMTVTIR